MLILSRISTHFRLGYQRLTWSKSPWQTRRSVGTRLASNIFAQDESSYPIAIAEWVVTSRLRRPNSTTGGVESRVFGVRNSAHRGGRYAHVADEYDRYLGFPRTFRTMTLSPRKMQMAGYACRGKLVDQWHAGRERRILIGPVDSLSSRSPRRQG